MRKIIPLLFVFALSCSESKSLKEAKKKHPIGSYVDLYSDDFGVVIRVKAKVEGYNPDGTLKLLVPVGRMTFDGRIMYGDTIYNPK